MDQELIQTIRQFAHPIQNTTGPYDPLLQDIGDRRFALLGEASHGTHEFYAARAEISKRLILEKGFNVIAVEADWPDAYRVHRYIIGRSDDSSAQEALGGFKRFPTWMWRNQDMLHFIEWLRNENDKRPLKEKVGFYGIDLYSLQSSIEEVLSYLQKLDPEAARRARQRYSCFDHFGDDSQAYGFATSSRNAASCEKEVVQQLVDLRRHALEYARRDGLLAEDEYFFAEQNARLVINAEEYYRSMFHGRVSSWNLRDSHMAETVEHLINHLTAQQRSPKAILWAHNSHLGDARATQMGERGEHNVGQLMREKFGQQTFLLGFTTYTGSVTAADDWGEVTRYIKVNPGMRGSYENLFHLVGVPDFYLSFQEPSLSEALRQPPRLQRAIGVIYRPETEFYSHYFHTHITRQFDAVIHFDKSSAVEPLDRSPHWTSKEAPETFPSGV